MRALVASLLASVLWACAPQPRPERPNVLVLVLDTTRADALSVAGNADTAATTPALDQLAAEGVLYTHARSTSAWTVPSHGSLFTGLYPSRHGAHHESAGLPEDRTTLAEVLAPTHQTAGFTENPHIVWDRGYAQGFESYAETWRSRTGWDEPLHTLDAVESWLGERDRARPFFVFVNLMTPHLPYAPPVEYQERFVPADVSAEQLERFRALHTGDAERFMSGALKLDDAELDVIRGLYRAEVAYTDARVARLVEMLRRDGSLDHTLMVVVSDHGENIGEHGMMEHQLCLYETLLRVPMILRMPGVLRAGIRSDAPVQLVDVMPTVLEAVGVDRDAKPEMEGVSLLAGDPPRERALFAEYMRPIRQRRHFARSDPGFDFTPFDRRLKSIQVGRWKLIAADTGETELYDLEQDPDERWDLAHGHDEQRARLEKRLHAFMGGDSFVPEQTGEATLDPETRRALQELGYEN